MVQIQDFVSPTILHFCAAWEIDNVSIYKFQSEICMLLSYWPANLINVLFPLFVINLLTLYSHPSCTVAYEKYLEKGS